LVSAWSEDNYDHIVPLAAGGLNHCTNIQLLCGVCNAKKAAGQPVTSSRYEAWFDDGGDDSPECS
jgi:5-methylcytosine-specific restriction endonuclease McrA